MSNWLDSHLECQHQVVPFALCVVNNFPPGVLHQELHQATLQSQPGHARDVEETGLDD